MSKKIISGIQPTSQITLGNFLGAIKLFKKYQEENELFIFVADLHALSSNKYNPAQMQSNILNLLKCYFAAGLNFKKTRIFIQSKVPAHTEMFNALINFTTIGELKRMTQFKDKSAKAKMANGTETINTGLLTYPVLMAGDILLYDAEIVPVGIDQKQHVELTRDIAIRINNKFNTKIFTIPEPVFSKTATKINDLLNPKIKMSKSNINSNGTIFITEDLEITRKKIMSAMTDNYGKVNYDNINQPGISNLINIVASILDVNVEEIVKEHANDNYKQFKEFVAKEVVNYIKEIQEKMNSINEADLLKEVEDNNRICNGIANKKIEKLYKLMGLKNNKSLQDPINLENQNNNTFVLLALVLLAINLIKENVYLIYKVISSSVSLALNHIKENDHLISSSVLLDLNHIKENDTLPFSSGYINTKKTPIEVY